MGVVIFVGFKCRGYESTSIVERINVLQGLRVHFEEIQRRPLGGTFYVFKYFLPKYFREDTSMRMYLKIGSLLEGIFHVSRYFGTEFYSQVPRCTFESRWFIG